LQARLQLADVERFHEVVVGARVEPVDAVLDRTARGQHQHRHAVTARPQLPAHLEPVEAGHADIEHDRVRRPLGHERKRLLAAHRRVDLVTGQRQRPLQRFAQRTVVIGDQQAHAAILPSAGRVTSDSYVALTARSGIQ
jgi:hypothetical protein